MDKIRPYSLAKEPSRATAEFDRGTLRILLGTDSPPPDFFESLGLTWDPRTRHWRTLAFRSRVMAERLDAKAAIDFSALGRKYLPLGEIQSRELRPYQTESLVAWASAGYRGIIEMPTGAGKTRVGLAAIAMTTAPTLVLAPTRVLVEQWVRSIREVYSGVVGVMGDGQKSLGGITVATFESAYRLMAKIGDHFRLLIIDEVHHFGEALRDECLKMSMAPMRMGLTATLGSEVGKREVLRELVGDPVFQVSMRDLAGKFLAPFEHEVVELPLSAKERLRYDDACHVFNNIKKAYMKSGPSGTKTKEDWVRFLRVTEEGRRAAMILRRARSLAGLTSAKLVFVRNRLEEWRHRKILMFVGSAHHAFHIAKTLLVPCLTGDIERKERNHLIDDFLHGRVGALVTCKVLNEGFDLPSADVALILSAQQSARDQIQRVGRVLRPAVGKRANIVELVSRGTYEVTRNRSMASNILAS